MVVRMTMSDITTISSIIVKPGCRRVAEPTRPARSRIRQLKNRCLPVLVLRAIEGLSIEGRVDVEHVLTTPPCRVRLVLVRSQSPLGTARHRVDRNMPEVLELAPSRVVGRGDAIDQRLQVRRVIFAANL